MKNEDVVEWVLKWLKIAPESEVFIDSYETIEKHQDLISALQKAGIKGRFIKYKKRKT